MLAVNVQNGAHAPSGFAAAAAGDGPKLVYLGAETETDAGAEGFSKSLTALLVTVSGLFGIVVGFGLGYVVRGRPSVAAMSQPRLPRFRRGRSSS